MLFKQGNHSSISFLQSVQSVALPATYTLFLTSMQHRFAYITIKCICVALASCESVIFISRNLHLSAGLVTKSIGLSITSWRMSLGALQIDYQPQRPMAFIKGQSSRQPLVEADQHLKIVYITQSRSIFSQKSASTSNIATAHLGLINTSTIFQKKNQLSSYDEIQTKLNKTQQSSIHSFVKCS